MERKKNIFMFSDIKTHVFDPVQQSTQFISKITFVKQF